MFGLVCFTLFTSMMLVHTSDLGFDINLGGLPGSIGGDYDSNGADDTNNTNDTHTLFQIAETLFSDFESQVVHAHIQLCGTLCDFPYDENILDRPKAALCAQCFCDPLCHVYDDCCPDILLLNKSVTMPPHFPATWEETKAMSAEEDFLTCETPLMKPHASGNNQNYTMVNYCPSVQFSGVNSSDHFSPLGQRAKNHLTDDIASWEDLVAKCKNSNRSRHRDFMRPLTSSSGVVFRNKYCAECHGQLADDLKEWKTSLHCHQADNLPTIASASEAYFLAVSDSMAMCNVRFLEDNKDVLRQCDRSVTSFISSCNQSGLWRHYDSKVERACASYTSVVTIDSGTLIYKNAFCFFCNYDYTVRQAATLLLFGDSSGDVARVSFYALLAFDGDDEQPADVISGSADDDNFEREIECNGDSVLDPFTCQCREVSCGANFHVDGTNCTSFFDSSNYFAFDVCAQFRLTSDVQITSSMYSELPSEVKSRFASIQITVKRSTSVPRLDCEDSIVATVDMEAKIYSLHIRKLQTMAEVIVSVYHSLAQSWSTSRSTNLSVIVPAPSCLRESELLDSIPDHCSTKNGSRSLSVFRFTGLELPGLGDEFSKYFRLQNTTFCPHVKLTEDEYRNFTTRLSEAGLSERNITSDRIIEKNETLYLVCVEDYHNNLLPSACQTERQQRNTMVPKSVGFQDSWTSVGLVSLASTSVSLLSLSCVIVTYSLLRPLRANMGASTLSMACLLFMAQILYELGIEQYEIHELCLLLAVLIHFFWLASVFMMSSCTLQLFYSVVYPLQARAVLASKKVLKISLACSFSLSIVIIGLVMLGNQLVYGDLGYPHVILCFIRRSRSRQLGFGLPLGLAVTVNIVTFIITTVHVRRLPDVSSTRENQVSLAACFRLSVITGLTWLSLFMLSVPGTRPWLEYVAVLLLGLQGLLLATTLLINKRVFTLWRDFFHRRHHRKGSKSSSAGGTTNSISTIRSVVDGKVSGK